MMESSVVILSILLLTGIATGKSRNSGESKFICYFISRNIDDCNENPHYLSERSSHNFYVFKKSIAEDEIPVILCKGACLRKYIRNQQESRKRSNQSQHQPRDESTFYSGW